MLYDIALGFVVVVLYVGVIAGLLALLAFVLSKNKTFLTSVPEGTAEVVYQGDDLLRPILNFEGYEVTQEGVVYNVEKERGKWVDPNRLFFEGEKQLFNSAEEESGLVQLVPATPHALDGFLNRFGIQFVSFIYPHRQIRELTIDVKRLIDSDEAGEDHSIRQRLEHESTPKDIKSLRVIVQRPVYIEKVELGGDKSQLNIVVNLILSLENLYQPYGRYNGKFFSIIDQAVSAEVIAFCQSPDVTYERFTRGEFTSPKDTKPDSDEKSVSIFSEKLLNINSGSTGAPTGLPNEIGYSVKAAWLVDYESANADFETAQRAKEINRQKADGLREKARGERDALKYVASGQAERWNLSIQRLIDRGVEPNVAAQVVANQIQAEAVGGEESKVTTWVQGNSDTKPMVPISDSK